MYSTSEVVCLNLNAPPKNLILTETNLKVVQMIIPAILSQKNKREKGGMSPNVFTS